jgi:hypothetical protein
MRADEESRSRKHMQSSDLQVADTGQGALLIVKTYMSIQGDHCCFCHLLSSPKTASAPDSEDGARFQQAWQRAWQSTPGPWAVQALSYSRTAAAATALGSSLHLPVTSHRKNLGRLSGAGSRSSCYPWKPVFHRCHRGHEAIAPSYSQRCALAHLHRGGL